MARNFDSLSPAYQHRLQRAGIDAKTYNSGASVTAARGHANTPERPERASKPQNRERYGAYLERRTELERKVALKKEEIFASSPMWDAQKSFKNIHESPHGGKPAKMASMERFIELGEDLFYEEDFEWDDDEWDFLYYH